MTSYDAPTNIDGGASMGSLSELTARVDRLEDRIEREAVLCASRDHDLSEVTEALRGQRRVLQALATTQSEHGAQLRSLTRRLGVIETQIGTIETQVSSIETVHGALLTQILGKLDRLTGDSPSPN